MKNAFLIIPFLLLISCTEVQVINHIWKKHQVNSGAGPACSKGQKGAPKIGKPYKSGGKTYYPLKNSTGFREKGIASWYGADFHGRTTANGECYDMYALTAAHPTLPLPTTVRVTNLENNRSVILRVNDRGPFARSRVIDLSYAGAKRLGIVKQGTAPVLVEAISGFRHASNKSLTRRIVDYKPKPIKITPKPAPKRETLSSRVTKSKTSLPSKFELEELSPEPQKLLADGIKLYVQTGAFASNENAIKQKNRINNAKITQHYRIGGSTLYRVRVGPFNNVQDADTSLSNLVNAGFNTAVIVVEK